MTEDNKDGQQNVVTLEQHAVAREVIYDTGIADPECITKMLEMVPISDEGVEMERKFSDARLDALGPIVPLIGTMAGIASMTLLAEQFELQHLKQNEDADKYRAKVYATYAPLFINASSRSAMAIIANLVSHGILTLNATEMFTIDVNKEKDGDV